MELTVRNMKRWDKPAIMRILRGSPEFTSEEMMVAEELIDSYLDRGDSSGYHTRAAEADSTIVGYVCFGPVPLTQGTWDVYWIVVAPEHQGYGVGTRLIASVEAEINGFRGRTVLVDTSSQPTYERARRFYESSGYTPVCRIPDFYGPGDDKVVFRKRLC